MQNCKSAIWKLNLNFKLNKPVKITRLLPTPVNDILSVYLQIQNILLLYSFIPLCCWIIDSDWIVEY